MLLTVGILIALASVAIIVAGVLAVIRSNEKSENAWFLALCLGLGVWVNVNFLDSNIRLAPAIGRLLVQIDFLLALLIGWALVQFVGHLIAGPARKTRLVAILTSPLAVVVSLMANLAVSGLLAGGLIISTGQTDGLTTSHPAAAFSLYVALIAVYFGLAFSALTLGYMRGSRAVKRRLSLVIVGFGVAAAVNILTNLIFPQLLEQRSAIELLNVLGYLGVLFLAICIYVAITTRKLFDIKLVIIRSLVYICLVGFVAALYTSLLTLISYILADDQAVPTSSLLIGLAATLFITLTFQYVKRLIDRLTNRLFFRDAYEPQEVLDHLTREITRTTDVDRIFVYSKKLFEKTLKSSYCGFILVDKNFRITHMSSDLKDGAFWAKRLLSLMPRSHKPLITELIEEDDERHELLNSLSAELVYPLYTTEGVFGFMVLGTKQNGTEYVQRDLQLLTIATTSLSIAVQNALRFEEIQKFSETLQQKVDDATRNLRASNRKLKKLNDTKDDFIGMASHQLRTPLTSVKGYLSLVLDGDAGKITPVQRQLLQQAFTSSQRVIFLIADLLNVSRLKTGKFAIQRVPTNLAKMIQDEVEQLRQAAAGRNISVTFNKPAHFPNLPLDEAKTRQVIMNFLDNAIYYGRPGGTINIELLDLEKSIELRVIDDGIGVPKSEEHQLWTKFYRAKNAQRARPDGTGLGLYMAKKVIVVQGGSIIFDSVEGQGSTFGFVFPKDMPADGPVADIASS